MVQLEEFKFLRESLEPVSKSTVRWMEELESSWFQRMGGNKPADGVGFQVLVFHKLFTMPMFMKMSQIRV